MRPKPQLSQQQTVDTKAVTKMALKLFLARPATAFSARLNTGAEAIAEPSTSTRAICMEKASRLQKPLLLPQASRIATGPMPVANMAAMYTTMLRRMANRNGSGSHRLTTFTQPLVNFLNKMFPSFLLLRPGYAGQENDTHRNYKSLSRICQSFSIAVQ